MSRATSKRSAAAWFRVAGRLPFLTHSGLKGLTDERVAGAGLVPRELQMQITQTGSSTAGS